jgi:hypothetical protein
VLRAAILSVFALASCSPQAATPPAAQSEDVREASFPAIKDISSLKIRLTRTSCFGVCPWYGVEIRGDGSVTYCGARWVKEVGERTRAIPETEVLALLDKFRAANFFKLEDQYAASITDNPTYIVQLSYDGQSKLVIDYVGREAGMPVSVTELETAIDETAQVGEWVGENMDPPPQPADTPKCIEGYPVLGRG